MDEAFVIGWQYGHLKRDLGRIRLAFVSQSARRARFVQHVLLEAVSLPSRRQPAPESPTLHILPSNA
jgi:hypothetical protein